MGEWQNAFMAYTTGTAFNVSLSHDQVSLLAFIDAGKYQEWKSRSGISNFIPCFRALERRGLAEHNPAAKAPADGGPSASEKVRIKLKWVYRLTPAGKHVLELLKLAGLVPTLTAANQDRAA